MATTLKRKQRIRRIILWGSLLIVVLILGGLGYGWFSLYNRYFHPERRSLEQFPEEFSLNYEDVILTTEDNLKLAGWLITPATILPEEKIPTLIAMHGYNTNRGDILPRIARLVRAGFQVFTYDHRSCGESEGEGIAMGILETEDLLNTVLPYVISLETVDRSRLGLYGFSMGGVVALNAAARSDLFSVVVVDSPYARFDLISEEILKDNNVPIWPFIQFLDWSMDMQFEQDIRDYDAVNVVQRVSPRPLLLLHGKADDTVPYSHAGMIIEAAGEPKKLVSFPGHDHKDNDSEEILDTIVVPFFLEAFGMNPIENNQITEDTEEM
jgi:dipeptidyl aminopeptidase/acylaminoacyl peptidase